MHVPPFLQDYKELEHTCTFRPASTAWFRLSLPEVLSDNPSLLWPDTLWHWLLHAPCDTCYVQLNHVIQKVPRSLTGNKMSDLSFVQGIGLLVPGGGRVYGEHLLRRWLRNTPSPGGFPDLLLSSLSVTEPTSLILMLKKASLLVLKGSLRFRSPLRIVLEVLSF